MSKRPRRSRSGSGFPSSSKSAAEIAAGQQVPPTSDQTAVSSGSGNLEIEKKPTMGWLKSTTELFGNIRTIWGIAAALILGSATATWWFYEKYNNYNRIEGFVIADDANFLYPRKGDKLRNTYCEDQLNLLRIEAVSIATFLDHLSDAFDEDFCLAVNGFCKYSIRPERTNNLTSITDCLKLRDDAKDVIGNQKAQAQSPGDIDKLTKLESELTPEFVGRACSRLIRSHNGKQLRVSLLRAAYPDDKNTPCEESLRNLKDYINQAIPILRDKPEKILSGNNKCNINCGGAP